MKYVLLLSPIVLFALSLTAVALAADDDHERVQSAQFNATETALIVDDNTAQQAGIVTQRAELSHYQREFIAYGNALSSEALLALHNRYLIALSEQQGTRANLTQSEQSRQRQQVLYAQGISSKRLLQQQQAQWQNHKALLATQQLHAQAIANEALLSWGSVLSQWIMNSQSKVLQAFLTGEKTLLHINLPSNKVLTTKQRIFVAASGDRRYAEVAELISPAPQNINGLQGINYFLQTRSHAIRAGMAITAWITEASSTETGITIPKSALIWSMDQAIVYLKTADKHFSRRVIKHYLATAEGYFINDDLHSGEDIVITGAQQLLSEELHRQIPDTED